MRIMAMMNRSPQEQPHKQQAAIQRHKVFTKLRAFGHARKAVRIRLAAQKRGHLLR